MIGILTYNALDKINNTIVIIIIIGSAVIIYNILVKKNHIKSKTNSKRYIVVVAVS